MSAFDETAPRSIGSTLVVALALWASACFSEGPALPGGDDDDATSGDDDDDATDSTDGGSGSCGGLGNCLECFQCVAGPMEACGAEGTTCAETNGCMIVSQCIAGCTAGGLCLDDCCLGHSGAAVDAALALDECQQDACVADPCSDYSSPQCG